MNEIAAHRLAIVARWITSALLVHATMPDLRRPGLPRIIGGAEIVAAVIFLLPVIWRVGAFLLLAIVTTAFAIHAASGHPPLMFIDPALVIVMVLMIEPQRSRVTS